MARADSQAEYELVLMLDPEAPTERRDQIVASTRERIDAGGTLKHDTTWGIRNMAFEIRQRNEADYRFFRFEAGGAPLLDELNHNLRIADGVLRFRIFKVDPRAPVIVPPPPGPLGGPPPRRDRRDGPPPRRGAAPAGAATSQPAAPEAEAQPAAETAAETPPAESPVATPAEGQPAAEAPPAESPLETRAEDQPAAEAPPAEPEPDPPPAQGERPTEPDDEQLA